MGAEHGSVCPVLVIAQLEVVGGGIDVAEGAEIPVNGRNLAAGEGVHSDAGKEGNDPAAAAEERLLHGGKIRVTGRQGEGAVFTVTLPFLQAT
jgi:hypothetical protein